MLEGWIVRSKAALAWQDPLGHPARDTPLQDRAWTWMSAALRFWAKGWDGAAGGRKAPLDGAWAQRLEDLFEGVLERGGATPDGMRQVDLLFNLAPELGGAPGLKARLQARAEARKIAQAAGKGKRREPSSRL